MSRRPKRKAQKMPDTAINYGAVDHRVRLHGVQVDQVASERAGQPALKITTATLDRLWRRDAITGRQWQAGEQLREDYRYAMGPSGGQKFGEPGGGGGYGAAPQVRQIEASERLAQARRAVGERLWRWLSAVVLGEESVGDASRQIGAANEQRGMGALLLSLDTLADHYRI